MADTKRNLTLALENEDKPTIQAIINETLLDEEDPYRATLKTGFKNLVINGDFRIAQLGISFTSIGDTLDRFGGSGGVFTSVAFNRLSSEADLGTMYGTTKYILRGRAILAGTAASIEHNTILRGLEKFSGRKLSIRFDSKASGTKKIKVYIGRKYNSGDTTAYLTPINVDAATSWGENKATFTLPTQASEGKTYDSRSFLEIKIRYAENDLGDGDTLDIARLQMEYGEVSTEFEERDISIDFDMCSRYLYVSSTTCVAEASTKNSKDLVAMADTPSVSFTPSSGSGAVFSVVRNSNSGVVNVYQTVVNSVDSHGVMILDSGL